MALAIALVSHVWPCVIMLCTVPPLWLRFTFFNVLLFSILGTNDQSLSGERDSSRDWDPHLDQNVQGGGLSLYRNLQCSNDESTCLDVHAGNPPGYSMDGTPKTAVEANDNSSVTAKSSPSHFEQEVSFWFPLLRSHY